MNWEQLLELAEMLAGVPLHGETRGRPQQTYLRKGTAPLTPLGAREHIL